MKKILKKSALVVSAACLITAAVYAKPKTDQMTGFEGSSTEWRAVSTMWSDGDKSTAIELSSEWASEGKKSLKCKFGDISGGTGAATYFTEKIDYPDISPYDALAFDVNNTTGGTVQVALALTTGSGWTWFESKPVDIPAGQTQNIRVEFYEGALKAAHSNWQHTLDLEDSDDLRRVAVKFFLPAGTKAGAVYIDNITMIVE